MSELWVPSCSWRSMLHLWPHARPNRFDSSTLSPLWEQGQCPGDSTDGSFFPGFAKVARADTGMAIRGKTALAREHARFCDELAEGGPAATRYYARSRLGRTNTTGWLRG